MQSFSFFQIRIGLGREIEKQMMAQGNSNEMIVDESICPGGLFVFKRAVRALFAVPKQLKSRVGLKSDATLKTDRGG